MPMVGANEPTMGSKGSVMSSIEGTPRASIWMASCKLHAVQAPQSPRPEITRCDRAARYSASSASIGLPAAGLLWIAISATGRRSRRPSAM